MTDEKKEEPKAEAKAKETPLQETALVDRLAAVFKDALNSEMTALKASLAEQRKLTIPFVKKILNL